MSAAEPKRLFKYYLDQQVQIRNERPLFFRRNLRWRVNSREYAVPLSKKGLLRGYIKYGNIIKMDNNFYEKTYQTKNFRIVIFVTFIQCLMLENDLNSQMCQFFFTNACLYIGSTRSLKSYSIKPKSDKK
jgi:hypothetical protein